MLARRTRPSLATTVFNINASCRLCAAEVNKIYAKRMPVCSLPMLTDSKRVGLAMEMACAELSGNGTQGSDDAKHPFPCAPAFARHNAIP